MTLLVIVCCNQTFERRDLGNWDWFSCISPFNTGLCGQTQPDVVWRCKIRESSQNSVSSSAVKTGSWREALDIIPAKGRAAACLYWASVNLQESLVLKACILWNLSHVPGSCWKYSLKFVASLRVDEFNFFFSSSFYWKTNLLQICPACLGGFVFPQDCLLKCWVEETTLVFWLLNGCKGIGRIEVIMLQSYFVAEVFQ